MNTVKIPVMRLLPSVKSTTRPWSLTLTPYHSERGAVVFQFVLCFQSAPPVALYRATNASRSVDTIAEVGLGGVHTHGFFAEVCGTFSGKKREHNNPLSDSRASTQSARTSRLRRTPAISRKRSASSSEDAILEKKQQRRSRVQTLARIKAQGAG